VLEWMLKRVDGKAGSIETPIGHLPKADDINLDGVELTAEARDKLFSYDRAGWAAEFEHIGEYLHEYGARMSVSLVGEQQRITRELSFG